MSTGSRRIDDLQEVNILDDKDQFIFFQNSTKRTKRVTKGNMANSGGGLRGIFINATTNENVWGVADYARTTANAANISASGAQASANGRNKIFYQADTPVASQFQGYIAATTLYADAISNTGGVPIRVGSILTGTGISAGTVVTAFGTGSGGAGTYTINNSQNVGSAGSKITITADPQFLEGDIWYETDNNYRTYRRSSSGTWVSAFAPILTLDGSNKVSGFIRVSDINGNTATDEFAVVASKFQIWNGSSDEVPFTVDASSPAVTFTGSITGSVLTLNSNASGTLKLGTNLTGTGVAANTVIKTLLSGTIGQSGSTYFLSQITSPSVSSVSMTASYAGQVRITDALIQTLDAGKITSGFLSSQVIELPNSQSYIQSANFVETWTSGKQYVKDGERTQPSDQSKVKVLGNDGTYTVYKATVTHTSGATFAGDSANWTTSGVSQTLQGFRIVGNGQADFQDCTVLGTIRSSVGHFGSNVNAVKIDSSGLVIGTSGSIISAGLTYTSSGWGSGSGFFLGNTGSAYEFFIGNNTRYLRWDGADLSVNGSLVAKVGSTAQTSISAGLVLQSGFGISQNTNTSILTINSGSNNGNQYGSQIDMVATDFASTGKGTVIITAGWKTGYSGARDGVIEFRTHQTNSPTELKQNDNSSFSPPKYSEVGMRRMIIKRDGEIIIGDDPGEDPEEAGQDGGHGILTVVNQIRVGGSIDSFGTDGTLYVRDNDNYNRISLIADDSGPSKILVKDGSNNTKITISSSGDITADSFTTSSSKKFKTDIKQLNSGIETIDKLKPVSFKRKGTKQQDIGLIAEEVDKVLPVIVKHNDKNEAEGLDYSKLTVILINAVKELSAEVKELKKKLKDAN